MNPSNGRPSLRARRFQGVFALTLALATAGWRSPAHDQEKEPPPSEAGCPCSLWPSTTAPNTDDVGPEPPVSLGVKVRSRTSGFIAAVRFYKSLANTGPHVGTLWAADGTALGSVTFKNETPSGWQTATFDRPIPIEANTIYVASYHTRTGHYAFATEYFTSADTGASPGPLTAPPSAEEANGVYRYGPEPAFPDSSYRASNYWVDVVFVPADMTAPPGAATDVSRIQFLDSLAADFARGAFDRTAIAGTSDGEVMLAPHGGSEFSGETTPRDWRTVGWDADGASVFAGGLARVDGARLNTTAWMTAGRSMEFAATFSGGANEHVGLGESLDGGPWAIFSSFDGSALHARTHNGRTPIDTPIEAAWSGDPHRYRIAWLPDAVRFYLDGELVATHETAIRSRMRPLASDLKAGGGAIEVDWIRVSPYQSEGTFVSRVFDGGGMVRWETIAWSAELPAGSRLAVGVRTGNTPEPDAGWSGFLPAAEPGAALRVSSRYVQYRLQLSTGAPDATPVVQDVAITGITRPD